MEQKHINYAKAHTKWGAGGWRGRREREKKTYYTHKSTLNCNGKDKQKTDIHTHTERENEKKREREKNEYGKYVHLTNKNNETHYTNAFRMPDDERRVTVKRHLSN